jgi:hypothetical protein
MGIRRGEVIEVFTDLSAITSDKMDQLTGVTSEPEYLPRLSSPAEVIKNMPRDSLRVRLIGDDFSIICYPFFPSHFRLPAKVGEEVWVFLEDFTRLSPTLFDPEKATSRNNIKDVLMASRNISTVPSVSLSLGFWMCRPACERQVEDLNYTAFGRVKYASGFAMQSASDLQANATRTSRTPTFPFYSETSDSLERVEKDDDLLRQRIEQFEAGFDLEPVARYTRSPGDTLIAGSNDARIVLGQTRAGRPAAAGIDAGSIDIVAGTGKGASSPNFVTNSLGKQEVDKDPLLTGKSDVAAEGDPSFSEDASRILVAESMDVDGSFDVPVSATGGTDTSSKSGAAVVVRSQHVRFLASEDGSVRIVVEGPTQSSIVIDSTGNIQIDAGAGVVVRSPSFLLTSQSGTGSTATSVLIDASGFQSQLSAALLEITAVLKAAGLPTVNTDSLVTSLAGRQFSSLITRSD